MGFVVQPLSRIKAPDTCAGEHLGHLRDSLFAQRTGLLVVGDCGLPVVLLRLGPGIRPNPAAIELARRVIDKRTPRSGSLVLGTVADRPFCGLSDARPSSGVTSAGT